MDIKNNIYTFKINIHNMIINYLILKYQNIPTFTYLSVRLPDRLASATSLPQPPALLPHMPASPCRIMPHSFLPCLLAACLLVAAPGLPRPSSLSPSPVRMPPMAAATSRPILSTIAPTTATILLPSLLPRAPRPRPCD